MKDIEKKWHSLDTDSVLAKLMCLDELAPHQPLRKQQRVLSDNYIRKSSSLDSLIGSSVSNRSQKPSNVSLSNSLSKSKYEDKKSFGKKTENRSPRHVLRRLQKLENDSVSGELCTDYLNNFLTFQSEMVNKPCLSSTGISVFKSRKPKNEFGDVKLNLLSMHREHSGKLRYEWNLKQHKCTWRDSKFKKENICKKDILERSGERICGKFKSQSKQSILSAKDDYSSVLEVSSGEASSNEFFDEKSASSDCSGLEPPDFVDEWKGTKLSTPDSVLEQFHVQNNPTFECFENLGIESKLLDLNSDLEETYSEHSDIIVSGDEDTKQEFSSHDGTNVHKWLRFDRSRDYSYLVDVLNEAGFYGENSITDFKKWDSLERQISPSVFQTLEKKYVMQTSWHKSERRLLFDRINSAVMDIVNSSSISKRFISRFTCHVVEDEVWMMLIRQEKEKSRDASIISTNWFDHGEDVNIICREVETCLFDELVSESANFWN